MPKITVRSHFPYSDEFTWITEMVDIDLDEERIKDVVSGRGFIIKSPKPIKEDLKDPDGIFSNKYGPTLDDINPYQDRYKCDCGYMRGKVNNDQPCPICHTKVKYVDDNFGYFGWAVLKEPYHVIHPSLFITLSKFIDNDTFLNIIKFSKEIDKDGNIAETKAPKNEPYYGIGMMGFYDKFEEIMEYYANKYKSKSKQEYYQVLMDAGKKKIFTHSIPVFTTLLRPYRVEGGDLHYEGINAIYKLLVALFANVSNDTNKIDKKEVIQNKLLYDAQMKIKELFDEIIKIFSGKKGSLRQLFGGRFNFTSRSVIVPDSTIKIDEIKLSYQCLCGLLQQVIINILRRSYNMSYNDAYEYLDEHTKERDPIIESIINGLIESAKREGKRGLPMIINRNPTINFGGIVGVYCVGISSGYTMSISLQIITGLAADFDGDTLNILYLINKDFCDAVMATFNPRNNFMISKNDGMFDPAVNHKRDTIINANTMIRLSRKYYTDEQLKKIEEAKRIG